MRTRFSVALVPALLLVAMQFFDVEFWMAEMTKGVDATSACGDDVIPAIIWALGHVSFLYGEDSDMELDDGGQPAKGQYDPDTGEATINYGHDDHWDGDGWSDDARITVGHEAIHAAVHQNPNVAMNVTILDFMGHDEIDEYLGTCWGGGQV